MIYQTMPALHHMAPDFCQQGAQILYAHALAQGRRGHFWSALAGSSRELLSLEDFSQACTVQARSSGGTRTVDIAQIRGSESRVADFDRDFSPLQEHTRDRWLGIAVAFRRGRCLPPVSLIQVGDCYFVRDGHHRISVARALGQQAIEATIEVWQVDQPLPLGQPSPTQSRNHRSNSLTLLRDRLLSLLRPAGKVATSPVNG